MTERTMKKLIRDMFACTDTPTFIWQGGEPTLRGLDFFEEVADLQRFHCRKSSLDKKNCLNAFQTNGVLLNQEWVSFLKRENFLVGISLDGPEHVHDQYRRYADGKGTFHKVFENAKVLQEQGVPVNILATVNDYSVKYAEEIYHFFVENGFIFFQFNPIVERDRTNPDIVAPYSVAAKDYGNFLTTLFNLWYSDFDFERLQQKTSIRFFDSLIRGYLGEIPDYCLLNQRCDTYILAEYNGDLFPCDFLVSANTRIGNLHEISIGKAFQSASHLSFGKRKADIDIKCKKCKWLNLCYGGCIKDRINDPKDNGRNHFCKSNQFFFQRADSRLRKLADLYRRYY
jgi:uncharacterized protein